MEKFNTGKKNPLLDAARDKYIIQDNTSRFGNEIDIDVKLIGGSNLIDKGVLDHFRGFKEEMMQIGFPEAVVNNINLRIITDSSGNKTVEVTIDLDIGIPGTDTIAAKIKEFVTGLLPTPYMGSDVKDPFD